MLTSNHFASCIKDLHPAVQGAARILDKIRDDLVQCYYEAEKDLSVIGKDVAEPLYVNMNQQLFEAAMELKKYGGCTGGSWISGLAPGTSVSSEPFALSLTVRMYLSTASAEAISSTGGGIPAESRFGIKRYSNIHTSIAMKFMVP